MTLRGPLVTTVVVVGGLTGFLAVNAVGATVVAGDSQQVSASATPQPPVPTVPTVPAAPPSTSVPKAPPASTTPPVQQFAPQVVYAGKARNSTLAIAVAVKGDQAAAYLCDGRAVESWLRGTAADARVDLKSKNGKAHLVARLQRGKLAGTVTLSGREYPFAIGEADPPAGLYRAANGSTTIGWIVLPDGSQVGIETTGGRFAEAPELDPARGGVTVGGQRLTVDKVAGDATFE